MVNALMCHLDPLQELRAYYPSVGSPFDPHLLVPRILLWTECLCSFYDSYVESLTSQIMVLGD